jgi:hypothetical protein
MTDPADEGPNQLEPALPAREWERLQRLHHHNGMITDIAEHRLDYELGALAWHTLDPDAPDEEIRAAVDLDERKRRHAIIAIYNATLADDDPLKITRDKVNRLHFLCDAFEPDDAVHSWLPAFADALDAYLPPE